MSRVWRRIIAGLEVGGGVFGVGIILWDIAGRLMDWFTFALAGVVFGIYLLSVVAGVLLWRNRRAGRVASIFIQLLQLFKLVSPPLTFSISIGFDFYIFFQAAANFSNVGFDLKVLAFHQFFLGMEGAPVGLGFSIPAAFFLIILLFNKHSAVVVRQAPPPPPVNSSAENGEVSDNRPGEIQESPATARETSEPVQQSHKTLQAED